MSQNDKIAEGLKFLREKYGFSSISCVPASTVDPKIIRFGNNVYPHKILHKEHADTELIDYSGEMSPEHCPLNMDNPLDWQFSIDGNVYKSNYSMISEKCRERLKAKYFIVNRSQLARINTKVLKETGKKWVMHVDSLKDFQSYTKALESKTYVIRSFQFYRCEEPEFYVLADDVIDLVILALQAQGVTEEEYDSHVKTLRFMNSSFEEEHFNVMKFDDFEEALEKFDIDKGLITIIPDMILKQNYVRSLTQLSIPITILNQEGDEIMTSPQAGMHIFHSMLCHYDWIGFMEKGEPEVDLTMELEAFFCDILKHYMDMRETTLVSRKYVEMDKEKLRNHRIFSKIQKQDRDHMWKDVEIFQDLPAKEYEKTCNKMNLPVYLVHNVLDLWYARLRWFVGCIEVFFTRESHEEKLFLISGLSQKCPGEAEPITQRFLSEIVHHWEKLRDEWEAKRPPLFSQGTEAVGNKKEEEKKIAKTSGDSKPSASKDSGKAVSKNPEGSGPGVSKAVQKSKTSSKPETSELSGKPQTKPDTQKSIVIKPSEQKSMKSGTPKNPRTPKSVATEKSMTSLETEKAAIMKKVTDELKEVKKTSEKMLKQKEKKKKLEEKLARETEISKNLKEALSEKERLIEELRQELANLQE